MQGEEKGESGGRLLLLSVKQREHTEAERLSVSFVSMSFS